jgi:hypothetical protein
VTTFTSQTHVVAVSHVTLNGEVDRYEGTVVLDVPVSDFDNIARKMTNWCVMKKKRGP